MCFGLESGELEFARRAVLLGFYEDALKRLADIQGEPEVESLRDILRARALLGQGRPLEAEEVISAVRFNDVNVADRNVLFDVARLLLENGMADTAARIFDGLLALCDTDCPDELLLCAVLAKGASNQSILRDGLSSLRQSLRSENAIEWLELIMFETAESTEQSEIIPRIRQISAAGSPENRTLARLLLLGASAPFVLSDDEQTWVSSLLKDITQPRSVRLRAASLLSRHEFNQGRLAEAFEMALSGLRLSLSPAEVREFGKLAWSCIQAPESSVSQEAFRAEKIFPEQRPELRLALEQVIWEDQLTRRDVRGAARRIVAAATVVKSQELKETFLLNALLSILGDLEAAEEISRLCRERAQAEPLWYFWDVSLHFLNGQEIDTELASKLGQYLADASFPLLRAAIKISGGGAVAEEAMLENLPEGPGLLLLRLLVAVQAARVGDKDKVRQFYQEHFSNNIRVLYTLVKEALLSGHIALASEILSAEEDSQRGDLWSYLHAEVELASGPSATNQILRTFERLASDSDEVSVRMQSRWRLAELHWNEGRYTAALENWRLLINEKPSKRIAALSKFFSALALQRLSLLAESQRYLSEILSIYANEVSPEFLCIARVELARILSGKDDPKERQQASEILRSLWMDQQLCSAASRLTAVLLIVEHGFGTDEELLQMLKDALAISKVPADLSQRALIQAGLLQNKMGRSADAEKSFLDVIYRRFPGADQLGVGGELYWFGRAVLEAGGLMERRQAWSEAVSLYRLAEQTILPESEFWRQRRQSIEREHLIFN